jgi:hypothetical protein
VHIRCPYFYLSLRNLRRKTIGGIIEAEHAGRMWRMNLLAKSLEGEREAKKLLCSSGRTLLYSCRVRK